MTILQQQVFKTQIYFMTILSSEFLLNNLQASVIVTLVLYLMTTVLCTAIEVTWIRLKNNVNTGVAFCPVTNTKFLRDFIYFIY